MGGPTRGLDRPCTPRTDVEVTIAHAEDAMGGGIQQRQKYVAP